MLEDAELPLAMEEATAEIKSYSHIVFEFLS